MQDAPPIFLISGSPGAGKSTVATALMRRFPFGLRIPVDDVRDWVVSGHSAPVPAWTDETTRQFALARRAAAETARLYNEAGFAVAIDDVLFLEEAQRLIADRLPPERLRKVALLPDVEVALRRNRERTHKPFDPEILVDTIRRLSAELADQPFAESGWLVLDNGPLTAEETVDAILAHGEWNVGPR